MRILAVDDDEIVRDLLVEFIDGSEHKLTTAPSASAAWEMITRSGAAPFDCILIDIQMPGVDGVQLCSMIRRRKPTGEVPILMLTARTDKEAVDAAFSAGATDYLTKPLIANEVRARLGLISALQDAQRRQQNASLPLPDRAEPPDWDSPFAFEEPLPVPGIDQVIDFVSMKNYVAQLSRSALFHSSVFALSIRKAKRFHSAMRPFEFHCLITDVAEGIAETFDDPSGFIAYAGSGTFVCVGETRRVADPSALAVRLGKVFNSIELHFEGERPHSVRISASPLHRLVWKSGRSAMQTLYDAFQGGLEAADNPDTLFGHSRLEKLFA